MYAVKARFDGKKVVWPRKAKKPPVGEVLVVFQGEQDEELNAATREFLAIPGFEAAMKRAEEDYKAGKGIEWRKVRQDV